jgi:chemotaxis protein MotA
MDLMTVLGAAVGFGVVYHILSVGQMSQFLLNAEAIILIFGGTLGSVMISYPWSSLRRVPTALKMMIFPPRRPDSLSLIQTFVVLAEKARKEGIESLSEDIPRLPHPYLADCLHMLLDGLEPDVVRERCERDILAAQQRHQQISAVFRSAGTYAPIFGLLGTLIGVVQVLRNITDPKAMGSSMAVAMTASFYGIFSANFLFLPIANKLSHYSDEDMLARELITKGILALQQGESPWLISRRLEAYLSFHLRQRGAGSFKVPT